MSRVRYKMQREENVVVVGCTTGRRNVRVAGICGGVCCKVKTRSSLVQETWTRVEEMRFETAAKTPPSLPSLSWLYMVYPVGRISLSRV